MAKTYIHDALSGHYHSVGADNRPSGRLFEDKETAKHHSKLLRKEEKHPYGDDKHGEGPSRTLNRLGANKQYRD